MRNAEFKIIPNGTVTTPKGFLAGAVYAGLKTECADQRDLGILYSEAPCAAAGVFTSNLIKSAPILVCQQHLADRRAQAVIINSGHANACTGESGLADAREMAELAARKLKLATEDVLVASTGVVGVPIPMELVRAHIGKIALKRDGGHELERAIMTTDTKPKEVALGLTIGDKEVTIGGIAKGSGMIHPNMATMLCFLATDAAVDPDFLQTALKRAVDVSFNMITVDGDMSPNDTAIILANGLAGNAPVAGGEAGRAFQAGLTQVCAHLARAMAHDGEGATKFIEVTVEGARTLRDARLHARTIVGSNLVKAAVYGGDPNWGRIVAAAGRSGAYLEEARIDLYLGDSTCLMKAGRPMPFDEAAARAVMGRPEVFFRLNLNLGHARATAWGCDLTEEYVTFNSAYTT
ncbi:MAG: bifunctional glutamate N-acetyltransferase/amino-acid acetyltransferase ArgJ [Chloroflexi bacterium]|nr:bifunctional glutamate N-acetyltransferase/amino-acid acetyltransferase ArgJ [Chloroflexota bacterium]